MSQVLNDSEDVLIEEQEGSVAILKLNRPDSLNALDPDLMRAFLAAVTRVADDDRVSCVVITGAGRGFCSGGDRRASNQAAEAAGNAREPLEEERAEALEQRIAWLRRSAEVTRILHRMPKPTIAMINGGCAGAGLSIAGACDLRFAAKSAKFVSAFTSIGMPGDYGGSWYWTAILGTAKARELYLLSDLLSSEEALEFGLVNRLFPDETLRAETMAIAQRIAALPGTGFAYAKENLNAALQEGLAASLDRESRNMMLARQALIEARRQQNSGSPR
jgi:2-(1,2-epoxy-1,2-dihydrophenyl)acetyl-CoA isomerase